MGNCNWRVTPTSKVHLFGQTKFSTLWKKKWSNSSRATRRKFWKLFQKIGRNPRRRGILNMLLRGHFNRFSLKEMMSQDKRARDYLRFGKREDMRPEDYDSDEQLSSPSKRFGRRRISNFLRFGWFLTQ